jgi:hypothetical protein
MWRVEGWTYIGAHAGYQDDATSTLRNHALCGFAGSKESPVDVDIVQTLDTFRWIAIVRVT